MNLDFKSFTEIDWNEIELDNIGEWPVIVKAICVTFVACLVLFFSYSLLVSDEIDSYHNAVAKEIELRTTYRTKYAVASKLDIYREQMVEMEESFGALVSQLPSDTEVPGLLEDITNKGLQNGLEIKSIDLQKEKAKEFYIELPIAISASGSYHDLGAFISGMASLPRIVTLHDFEISTKKKDGNALDLKITAKTYRYKDEEA